MKVLILGSKGMLGQALMKVFGHYRPVGWGMMELDITDEQRVKEKIGALKPQVVLNAAAYTDVDMAETAEDIATKVNGYAVSYLAEASSVVGATMVHYSTDYVFDGQRKSGYPEDAKPYPLNAYGRSKLLGEKELKKKARKYYLIRTSWLFGCGGKNFVDHILMKSQSESRLEVVNDQFGKPSYALDVALQTRLILEQHRPYGIYHVTNETVAGGITWYEFAKTVLMIKGSGVTIRPCFTDALKRAAKRPKRSVLINTKLPSLRDYTEALSEYVQ